jgi:hypothetical protein
MRFSSILAGGLGVFLFTPLPAKSQTPVATPTAKPAATPVYTPYKIGDWTVSGSLRARAEYWDWFSTPGFNDSYGYGAYLLRAGLTRQTKNADFAFEIAQPTLFGVPDDTIAPPPAGQLGHGASYRAVNGEQDGSIFVKTASIRFKNLGSKANSLRLGRFEFIDGAEVAPKDASLAWLKRERINHRLIGNFGFTHVGRSFDGAQFSHDAPGGNVTLFAGQPTEGVFQLNGLGRIDDIYTAYAAYTKPMKSAEGRLFYIRYHDGRGLAPVDNRPAALRATDTGDISINTFGANYLRTMNFGSGKADFLAWGTLQTGKWGSQDHRAHAVALEAGYQPGNMKWKPWLRAGYFNGSGDSTPEAALGGKHETFFQILPTPRIYARFPFYNLMNNEDLFAQAILRPNAKTTVRAEAHRLRLSEAGDLWYLGGGAFNEPVFGYQGRPSGGQKGLANVFEISIDRTINPLTSVTLFAGHAAGGRAVNAAYPAGNNANFVYLELTRKF